MGVVRDISQEIGGVTYTTRLFPASEGLELGRRLARLISEDAVAMALMVAPEEGEKAPEQTEEDRRPTIGQLMANPHVIATLILGASRSSEAGEWSSLCQAILKNTTADKVRVGDAEIPASVHKHFDSHFAGRYQHLFEVVVWAVRVGFGGP